MNLIFALMILTAPPDTASTVLRRGLEAAVRVEAVDDRFLSVEIDPLAQATPVATLVNQHRAILNYLLISSLPARVAFDGVDPKAGEAQRTQRFLSNVLRDSSASAALESWYSALQPHASPTRARPVISEARLLEIATRFFYPARISGDTLQVYRCAGINGAASLGPLRDIAIEAFAFVTVLEADSAPQLDTDFASAQVGARRLARQSGDTARALHAAREFMYRTMGHSAGLHMTLRQAYERERATLPFQVREWEHQPTPQ